MTTPPRKTTEDPTRGSGWFDAPENVRKVLLGLFAASGLLLAIDVAFFLLRFDKHPYFRWEQWPGFQAAIGFVSCVAMVTIARFVVRPLTKRREDIYESGEKGGRDA